jgi:D-alanyl-D-alanine carboxypeptidase
MLATMTTASTSIRTAPPARRRRRIVATAASVAVVGAVLGMSGCSPDDDGGASATATAAVASAPRRAAPVPAPPTTPSPAPPPSLSPPPIADDVPSSTAATLATTAPSPTVVAADPAHQAQLAAVLAEHQAAGEFVGARIAVREPDGTISEASAGTPTVDPASGPVDADVPWNIGSATKAFVAVVVLQLADEGRLDLDSGVGRYVPYLPDADRITPRQLLNHTSGLGEYLDQPAVVSEPARHWTPAELVVVADAAGRVGEPGGPHRYSNSNYVVLGDIIEQVTGRPWADEVRARITEPLGMTHTGLAADAPVPGFDIVDGAFVEVTHDFDPSLGGAAGGLHSTSRDLLAFAAALADGTLVPAEARTAMETFLPAEDLSRFGIDHGYGLGVERYLMDGMTVIGHMGTGKVGSSYVGYDAERGTTVAVTTNTAVAGPAAIMAVQALTAIRAAE